MCIFIRFVTSRRPSSTLSCPNAKSRPASAGRRFTTWGETPTLGVAAFSKLDTRDGSRSPARA